MMELQAIEKRDGSAGWLFNHLPVILWQRRWYVLGAFLAIFAAGLIAAFALPTMYRSTATLLVQSQDLPTEIVDAPATGDIEQRIARIRERVLSRGDLIALIEQNDLYPDERRSEPMSYVVDKMRRATSVGALAGDIGQAGGSKSNVIAITMSFDYPDPSKAQAVLQAYVTRFLRMDSDAVEDQATLTVRFLEDQAGKLQGEISAIEGQITALKASNGAALANTGFMSIDSGSYSAQIVSLENQNRQLLAAPAEHSQISAAEAALAAARATFNDSHPDVVLARQRLQELQAIARANPGSGGGSVQEQIRANNAAIAQLTAARNAQLAKANAAMAGQARAPAILEQAMQLENRANGLREQYRGVSTNLLKAQNSARMATEQRAERLSLVDPPTLPDQPHWPNRTLLIAGGAVAGLLFGLVLALGLELIARPVRSPNQIEALALAVLGVVPVLSSEAPRKRWSLFRRRRTSLA